MKNKNIGSSLDSFLEDNEILAQVEEEAACNILALKLSNEIKSRGMSISEFARRMGTTRAVATRVLNPQNKSLTFKTALRASSALGFRLKVDLIEAVK